MSGFADGSRRTSGDGVLFDLRTCWVCGLHAWTALLQISYSRSITIVSQSSGYSSRILLTKALFSTLQRLK